MLDANAKHAVNIALEAIAHIRSQCSIEKPNVRKTWIINQGEYEQLISMEALLEDLLFEQKM